MNRTKWQAIAGFMFIGALLAPVAAQAERLTVRQAIQRLDWQYGPSVAKIGDRASIKLGSEYAFLSSNETTRFLTLTGNLPSPNHYAVAPRNLSWFVVFSFDETGYIKDDEKIDTDDVLNKLRAGTARNNEERKRRGIRPIYLDGWAVKPHYDEQTKRLEWGTRLTADNTDEVSVNYSIRILGRMGVMHAILVTDPNALTADVREFKTVLGGYNFDSGQRYSEFRKGDKIAAYGLTGLILGGGVAVAAKTGLLKYMGKFIVYIFGGLIALVGGLIKSLFGRRAAA